MSLESFETPQRKAWLSLLSAQLVGTLTSCPPGQHTRGLSATKMRAGWSWIKSRCDLSSCWILFGALSPQSQPSLGPREATRKNPRWPQVNQFSFHSTNSFSSSTFRADTEILFSRFQRAAHSTTCECVQTTFHYGNIRYYQQCPWSSQTQYRANGLLGLSGNRAVVSTWRQSGLGPVLPPGPPKRVVPTWRNISGPESKNQLWSLLGILELDQPVRPVWTWDNFLSVWIGD